jgi:uncharacterized LabA/DUF88 family protein
MKKDLVIFDGSNFYHSVKRMLPKIHLLGFNYRKLAETIAKNKNIDIEYCVGEIKQNKQDKKSLKMYAGQQSLFYNLESQKIKINKGFMLKSNNVYHEKGVDVRIAVDILRGALKNEYRKCYIISSDTDIIPAILEAKKAKKQVVYVGFQSFISQALRSNCSEMIKITKAIIKNCCL